MSDYTESDSADESNLSPEESEERELPKEWVETYLGEKEWIKGKLSDIKELKYKQKNTEVLDELKNIRSYDEDIFKTIFYSVYGQEEFHTDVKEQINEDVADQLLQLGKEYEFLLEKMAFILTDNKKKNPISGGTISEPEYHPENHTIYVPYSLRSVDRELIEVRDTPGNLLHGSFLLSEAAFEGVRAADDGGLTLEEYEVERVKDKLQRLKSMVEDIENSVDEIQVISED